MPKVFVDTPAIGIYIPLRQIPCLKYPGDDVIPEHPTFCTKGVPYEVVACLTLPVITADDKHSHRKPATRTWIGLRPESEAQKHLDWILVGYGQEDPVGVFVQFVNYEET